MKTLILILCLFIPMSIAEAGSKKIKHICPQGYKIQIETSFLSTGVYLTDDIIYGETEIKDMICTILDDRVQEWIDSRLTHPDALDKCGSRRYTITQEELASCLYDIALSRKYKILNCMHYRCGISYTGMCAGDTSINAPLYSRYKGRGLPDFNYPPHTVQTGQSIYDMTHYKGWLEFADYYYIGSPFNYLPVIGHELDHKLGIGH